MPALLISVYVSALSFSFLSFAEENGVPVASLQSRRYSFIRFTLTTFARKGAESNRRNLSSGGQRKGSSQRHTKGRSIVSSVVVCVKLKNDIKSTYPTPHILSHGLIVQSRLNDQL